MREQCALCLLKAELKKSHIMPQSMYKAAGRAHEPTESDLITIDNNAGTAIRTSYQLKQELLCAVCEKRMHSLGENYFARNCFRGSGKFGLREKLYSVKQSEFYSGRKSWNENCAKAAVDVEAVKYFILSILWRHSVCSIGGPTSQYRGALGKIYEEQCRQFLVGETSFPFKFQVFVFVDDNAENASFIDYPTCEWVNEFSIKAMAHSFAVPGLRIRTLVGGPVEKLKLQNSSEIIFHQWNSQNTEYARSIAVSCKNAVPKGKLKNERRTRAPLD